MTLKLCHDNWSTQIMQFSGQPYNQMTLESQIGVDLKQTKYAACDPCADKIVLYSHLHHQKYNFFCKCKQKVSLFYSNCFDFDLNLCFVCCLGREYEGRRRKQRITCDIRIVSSGQRMD